MSFLRTTSISFSASIVLGVFALPALVSAATYYVSKSGSDSNSCIQAQTDTAAKLTITAGIKCLASGDTLIVKGGTYNETVIVDVPSGSASAYTTIRAASGEAVWVRPTAFNDPVSYFRTNPFALRVVDGRHHIKIENINIDGSGYPNQSVSTGSLFSGDKTHHLIFDGMEMKHSRGDAVMFRPSAYGNTLRNSYIHDVEPSGGDNSPAACLYLGSNRTKVRKVS